MPVKFKPSQTALNRASGKTTTTHYYMKNTSTKELIEYINSTNGKPKVKIKCRNELDRRGVKLVWTKKEPNGII